MSMDEILEVMKAIGLLDLSTMDILDQTRFILATEQFAQRVKPLIAKYSDRLPEKTTFLFKM